MIREAQTGPLLAGLSVSGEPGHLGRLLRRPRLRDRESLRGYILRVENENGSTGYFKILNSLSAASDSILAIATATDCDAEELSARVSIMPREKGKPKLVSAWGQLIPARHVRMSAAKWICPKCLATYGVMSALWELNSVITCYRHGIYLTNTCLECRQPLRWDKGSLKLCACGSDLTKAGAKWSPEGRCRVERFVAAKLFNEKGLNYVAKHSGIQIDKNLDLERLLDHMAFVDAFVVPMFEQATTGIPELAVEIFQSELSTQLVCSGSYGYGQLMVLILGRELAQADDLQRVGVFRRHRFASRETLRVCFGIGRRKAAGQWCFEELLVPAWDFAHIVHLERLKKKIEIDRMRVDSLCDRLSSVRSFMFWERGNYKSGLLRSLGMDYAPWTWLGH